MKPVKFRCVRSGNVITMRNEVDIAELRKHESYREVIEEYPPVEKVGKRQPKVKQELFAEVPDFIKE